MINLLKIVVKRHERNDNRTMEKKTEMQGKSPRKQKMTGNTQNEL